MSHDTDPLDDRFAVLLEQGAQALAVGSPWYPENDPGVPPVLVPRLKEAGECLALLKALWPRAQPDQSTEEDLAGSSAHVIDFDVAPPRQRIGHFEVLSELGRGGMGVVYKAWQTDLRRSVALKMILAGVHSGSQLRERFRREAEVLAALRHPHIVQIYETGEHEDCPYFSQEFMDGGTLAKYVAGQAQPPREAAEILLTLAQAVQYAHETGVLHRDLKLSNILLQHRTGTRRPGDAPAKGARPKATGRISEHYFVKVADFGLAREMDEDATRTGLVMGTPPYMAPEQAEGNARQVKEPADVYGLGAILYELLTGRPPFKGKSHRETLEQVKRDDPVPPRRLRREVDRDLEKICLKCLQKEPRQRFGSAQQLADDLGRFLRGEPVRARPPSLPRRIVRRARRHTTLVSVGVLLLALLGSLAFAGAYWRVAVTPRPPAKQLDFLLGELQAGRAVELVGENGPPSWSNWAAGETPIAATPEPEFIVNTWRFSLLELLPRVPCDHYRVRFDTLMDTMVRETRSHAGIYLSHRADRNAAGPEHLFVAVCLERAVKERWAGIEVFRVQEPNPLTEGMFSENYVRRLTIPIPPGPPAAAWQRFDVDVSAGGVQARWEGADIQNRRGPLTREEIEKRFRFVMKPEPMPAAGRTDFDPRGGLGIFVHNEWAPLRNVVVEPLNQ